jgi:hypothetical protein
MQGHDPERTMVLARAQAGAAPTEASAEMYAAVRPCEMHSGRDWEAGQQDLAFVREGPPGPRYDAVLAVEEAPGVVPGSPA